MQYMRFAFILFSCSISAMDPQLQLTREIRIEAEIFDSQANAIIVARKKTYLSYLPEGSLMLGSDLHESNQSAELKIQVNETAHSITSSREHYTLDASLLQIIQNSVQIAYSLGSSIAMRTVTFNEPDKTLSLDTLAESAASSTSTVIIEFNRENAYIGRLSSINSDARSTNPLYLIIAAYKGTP